MSSTHTLPAYHYHDIHGHSSILIGILIFFFFFVAYSVIYVISGFLFKPYNENQGRMKLKQPC